MSKKITIDPAEAKSLAHVTAPRGEVQFITTYDGSNHPTHPSVVYRAGGWNGFPYWMVMTPYPTELNTGGGSAESDALENPSILCSLDGYTWQVPVGLTNPIEPHIVGGDCWSDPCMFFDGDTLVCTYRYNGDVSIHAKTSTDGVHWSSSSIILAAANTSTNDRISPAFIKTSTGWAMFATERTPSPNHVSRRTATDWRGPWSDPTITTGLTPTAGNEIWHLGVVAFDETTLHAFFSDHTTPAQLYGATSTDGGLTWIQLSNPMILSPATGRTDLAYRWDRNIYKPCPLPIIENGVVWYRLWYSAVGPTIADPSLVTHQIGHTELWDSNSPAFSPSDCDGLEYDLIADRGGYLLDLPSGNTVKPSRLMTKTVVGGSSIFDVAPDHLAISERTDGGGGFEAIFEELRVNYLSRTTFNSTDGTTGWTTDSAMTCAVFGPSPHVGSNALLLVADSSDRAFWKSYTLSAATHCLSFYVKSVNGGVVTSNDIQLCAAVGTTTPVDTLLTTIFTQLGSSEWYRAVATFTGTAVVWAVGITVKANKSVLVCCPQEEVGAFPTSYIPAASSGYNLSRYGDSLSVDATSMSKDQGTIIAICGEPVVGQTNRNLFGWGSTSTNGIHFKITVSTLQASVASGGVFITTESKERPRPWSGVAMTWSAGKNLKVFCNDTAYYSSTVAAAPVSLPDNAYIGYSGTSSAYFDGPIHRVLIYSTVLTDAQIHNVISALRSGPPASIMASSATAGEVTYWTTIINEKV